jgi:nicotinamidase-related amidase
MRCQEYATNSNLGRLAGVWLDTLRLEAAPRPQLVLSPTRCAMLIIDMNNYFADPGGRCFLPAAATVAPRIRELLDAWRGAGGQVVFTRHGHEHPGDLGMLGRFFSDHIDARGEEAEIIEALAPGDDEPVLGKTTYDAFLGTPLEPILRDRGIDQVLITGVLTHMCCETTARSAFCRGFEVYVPVDATASSSLELHLGSLRSMADAVAVLVGVDEVLALCARSA